VLRIMDPVNSDALLDEANRISAKCITDGSRRAYLSKIASFIDFMEEYKPYNLTSEFRDLPRRDHNSTRSGPFVKKEVIKLLNNVPPRCPIANWEALEVDDIRRWLIQLCPSNSARTLSKATYSSARSAIYHLYRMFGRVQPASFDNALETFFKGMKRQIAEQQSRGERPIKEGKDALTFGLYVEICKRLLLSGKPEDIFAHCYMVLSWNLICRASSTSTIQLHHLGWSGDALTILFAHLKNDRPGGRAAAAPASCLR